MSDQSVATAISKYQRALRTLKEELVRGNISQEQFDFIRADVEENAQNGGPTPTPSPEEPI